MLDDVVIEKRLENLDRRLANVEQILPRLATKEDLGPFAMKGNEDLRSVATKEEIRSLAIKEQVSILAIEDKISTLATKEELRAQGERLQRHMDVVGEALRSGIQLLAEHLASVMPKGTGAAS